jgi:putative membrane protein
MSRDELSGGEQDEPDWRMTLAGFLLRLFIVALGLWLASELVPGIEVRGGATLLGAAILLGIVNAIIRPIVIVLTLPITILTLGVFLLVVNAAMLGLVASLFEGFRIAGFWSALLGSIVVSITAWTASWLIGPRGRVELMVVRNRG